MWTLSEEWQKIQSAKLERKRADFNLYENKRKRRATSIKD
jgi:hypothetical protein